MESGKIGVNKPKMPTLGRSKDVRKRLWENLAATAGTENTRPQNQKVNVRVSVHFLGLGGTSLGELKSPPSQDACAAIKAMVC